MGKSIGAVLLAAVLLWVWGFAFWTLNPLPYETWKSAKDDRAAQLALLQHFPSSGTYHIPSRAHSAEEERALLHSGPWGFVQISYAEREPLDIKTLAYGLLLNFVFAAGLAMLMFRVRSTARTYSGRLGVPFWAGLIAVVLIDGGDVVWWSLPYAWQMHVALYNFSAFLITGAVLAFFIKGTVRDRLA